MMIPENYKPEQIEIAKIMAYLTNSVIYSDKGKLCLADMTSLNNIINQLLADQNFIAANDLIKVLKEEGKPDSDVITSEIISKSIRIPFKLFLKIFSFSRSQNMSGSDAIRKMIIPQLESTMEQLRQSPGVDTLKMKKLQILLNEWRNKKTIFREPWIAFDINVDSKMNNIFINYLKYVLIDKCIKMDIPTEIIDVFISRLGKFDPADANTESLKEEPVGGVQGIIRYTEGSLSIELSVLFGLTADNEMYIYDGIKSKYGNNIFEKFEHILDCVLGAGELLICAYNVSFIDETMIINNIELSKDNEVNKSIYFNLLKNIEFDRSCKDHKSYLQMIQQMIHVSTIEDSSIIEGFDSIVNQQKLQDALKENNYELASQLGDTLTKHQVIEEITRWIIAALKNTSESSQVISFTIPASLYYLFELFLEGKNIKTILNEQLKAFNKR